MTTLEREREKLAWLRKKTAEQAAWVATLEKRTEGDSLDDAFERELSANHVPVVNAVQQHTVLPNDEANTDRSEQPSKQLRSLPAHWVRIFQFIGREGKESKAITSFVESNNLPIKPDAMRTALMNYRRNFALVTNPTRGFYVITDAGMKLVDQDS